MKLTVSQVLDAIAGLHAENERLRADAERYRHMRDAVRTSELLVYSKGCDLDAAIDAARAALKEPT